MKVIELDESNFDRQVRRAHNPVVVQFWAGWSELSKAMTALLESVVENEAVPVKLARVNVDHHEALAEAYGVQAVPTVLIFHQGGLRDQIVGRASEQELRQKLEPFK